jgi:hypothetical protein
VNFSPQQASCWLLPRDWFYFIFSWPQNWMWEL